MKNNEAKARIRIDQILKKAGWRLIDGDQGKANVGLEENITMNEQGEDFEKTKNGKADYLLYDESDKPIAVLEAKSEKKSPLDGKDQARDYANSKGVLFIILSNGLKHYFWELKDGCNPEQISIFPTQKDLSDKKGREQTRPLHKEEVDEYYIAETEYPDLRTDPDFINEETRSQLIRKKGLKVLRPYQLAAVHALQESAKEGNKRFLFEMATGTGKTLISSAVIKLFFKTANAKRILFLVDRLELESQAEKSFKESLKTDLTTVIYNPYKEDWKSADIVVSTIQRLYSRYKDFSPLDFDLVISDEAHRSISGDSRAVFEHFLGYKLGLTATPKDYLKNIKDSDSKSIKAMEKRRHLDTYITFGCGGDRKPTFKYDLEKGIKENYLIKPVVVDARTDITTELLDSKGYAVIKKEDAGELEERYYYARDYEKNFFNKHTNETLCQHFLEHALKDPFSDETGKSIIFCVNQNHASKITNILNQLASKKWPDKYQSDFAVQITSNVKDAQENAESFAKNNLNGRGKFLEGYKTSKTRVCVTVGMMTTGYDCRDILNLCFMRPLFSPILFIQMKGRGTRKHEFLYQEQKKAKDKFQIFDYFAVCEYFDQEFEYDKELPLPTSSSTEGQEHLDRSSKDVVNANEIDKIKTQSKRDVPDVEKRMFENAVQTIGADTQIIEEAKEDEDKAVASMREKYEDKPHLYLNLEKIRRSEKLDRNITWKELLHVCIGKTPHLLTKNEILENSFEDYANTEQLDENHYEVKSFFKNYAGEKAFRYIIDNGKLVELESSAEGAGFSMDDMEKIASQRENIIKYINTYIDVDQFNIPS